MSMIFADGMPGIPIPYLLRSDGMVTSIMFLCILLISFVFSRNKKHLMLGLKNFIQNRERGDFSEKMTSTDARHTFLLLVHTTIMLGFCGYHYLSQTTPLLFDKVSHSLLLGLLVFSFAVFIFLKYILYKGINWIFFQKVKNSVWIATFVHLFVWLGILLLPLVLLIVYFDIPPKASVYTTGSLLILAKITLFWKCFSNFFEKIYGALHLILYFCALEILPDLIFWKGMEIISNNLTLNL